MTNKSIDLNLCEFVEDSENANIEWILEDGRDISSIRVGGKYYKLSDKVAEEGDKIFIRKPHTERDPYSYGDICTVEVRLNALGDVLATVDGTNREESLIFYREYCTLNPLSVENGGEDDIIRILASISVLLNEQNNRISDIESDIKDLRENLTEDNYEKTRRLSEIERSLDNLKVVRSDSRTDLD